MTLKTAGAVLYRTIILLAVTYYLESSIDWSPETWVKEYIKLILNLGSARQDNVADFTFSKLRTPESPGEIETVDVSDLTILEAGRLVEMIYDCDPNLVGLDIGSLSDTNTYAGLGSLAKLRAFHKFTLGLPYSTFQKRKDELKLIQGFFPIGFTDLAVSDSTFDELARVRSFDLYDSLHYSYPLLLAYLQDPVATTAFIRRAKNGQSLINYSIPHDNFIIRSGREILKSGANFGNGKIFLLGDFRRTKFYTPFNKILNDFSNPDMAVSMIHANILQMASTNRRILEVRNTVSFAFTFLITFLHMWILYFIEKKLPLWYEGTAFAIGLVITFGLNLFQLALFYYFSIKLNLGIAIATVAAMTYYAVLHETFAISFINMIKKFKRRGAILEEPEPKD